MKVRIILATASTATWRKMAGLFPADWEIELSCCRPGASSAGGAPDLVIVEADGADAGCAYAIATRYRARGSFVVIYGSQATLEAASAAAHADTIFIGPCEQTLRCFLRDWIAGHPSRRYIAGWADVASPALEPALT